MDKTYFYHNHCRFCGSQRCKGPGTEWFVGCKYKRDLDGYENSPTIEEMLAEIEKDRQQALENKTFDVIEIAEHNDLCGGLSYTYHVEHKSKVIKDLIEEIKEYTASDERFRKVGSFGCDPAHNCNDWSIYINDRLYFSTNERRPRHKYRKSDLTKPILSVEGHGGWYRAIDFYIVTE